jgi:hypothetical protein
MTRQALWQARKVAAGLCQSCGKRPIAKKKGVRGPAPKSRCRTCLTRKYGIDRARKAALA